MIIMNASLVFFLSLQFGLFSISFFVFPTQSAKGKNIVIWLFSVDKIRKRVGGQEEEDSSLHILDDFSKLKKNPLIFNSIWFLQDNLIIMEVLIIFSSFLASSSARWCSSKRIKQLLSSSLVGIPSFFFFSLVFFCVEVLNIVGIFFFRCMPSMMNVSVVTRAKKKKKNCERTGKERASEREREKRKKSEQKNKNAITR